jgi:hypothetical protein
VIDKYNYLPTIIKTRLNRSTDRANAEMWKEKSLTKLKILKNVENEIA